MLLLRLLVVLDDVTLLHILILHGLQVQTVPQWIVASQVESAGLKRTPWNIISTAMFALCSFVIPCTGVVKVEFIFSVWQTFLSVKSYYLCFIHEYSLFLHSFSIKKEIHTNAVVSEWCTTLYFKFRYMYCVTLVTLTYLKTNLFVDSLPKTLFIKEPKFSLLCCI